MTRSIHPNDLRLLRLEEVQERLALSRSSVARLVNNGELPSVRVGKARRVRLDDLLAFLDTKQATK